MVSKYHLKTKKGKGKFLYIKKRNREVKAVLGKR